MMMMMMMMIKKVVKRTNYILDTLSIEYTRQIPVGPINLAIRGTYEYIHGTCQWQSQLIAWKYPYHRQNSIMLAPTVTASHEYASCNHSSCISCKHCTSYMTIYLSYDTTIYKYIKRASWIHIIKVLLMTARNICTTIILQRCRLTSIGLPLWTQDGLTTSKCFYIVMVSWNLHGHYDVFVNALGPIYLDKHPW